MATLSLALFAWGCGVKKIGSHKVDKKCDRDLWQVWGGEACPAIEVEQELSQVVGSGGTPSVCTKGVNNNFCQIPLVEDSVWSSTERSYDAPTGESVSYIGYYKFNVGTQTWEHYLFQKIPFLDYPLYERRAGSFEIHSGIADEYIVMTLDESSCAGQQSLFEIFDTPKRDVYIGRSGSVVQLAMSAEFTSGFGIKLEMYLEHIFASIFTYLYDLLFAPFTPEFWQSVVTGSYSYSETTQTDFEAAVTAGRLSCFSSEGYATIEADLNIPPLVKAALDAAR